MCVAAGMGAFLPLLVQVLARTFIPPAAFSALKGKPVSEKEDVWRRLHRVGGPISHQRLPPSHAHWMVWTSDDSPLLRWGVNKCPQ